MIIDIDEKSGFCFGVVKAIEKAEQQLEANGKLYALGDLMHNKAEMERLKNSGLMTMTHVDLPRLSGETVLVRAHGEPPTTFITAQQNNVTIIDATCPVVNRLQKIVVKAQELMNACGGQVVILGKVGHPEVVGLNGQINGAAIVIESLDDIDKIDFNRPIYLLSQTTKSLTLFEQIREAIQERLPNDTPNDFFTVKDTICRQVSNRYPHLRDFASQYNVIIFVSGNESSNGKALYENCLTANSRCYKIEKPEEINFDWFNGVVSIGICGATSTPRWAMEIVKQYILSKINNI